MEKSPKQRHSALLLVLVWIKSVNSSPEPNRKEHARILGGVRETIEEVPWLVQVCDGSGEQFCGGALISTQWVLTAAHCVHPEIGVSSGLTVRAGSSVKNKGGKAIRVARVTMHPLFDPDETDADYDFALLKLVDAFRLGLNIDTIGLASKKDVFDDEECVIAGWGQLEKQAQTHDLMSVWIPLVEWDECERDYRDRWDRIVTRRMICAGGKGGKDACQGDSGGPLVCRGKLVGVTSWGVECGENYGVYADVTSVKKWIRKVSGVE